MIQSVLFFLVKSNKSWKHLLFMCAGTLSLFSFILCVEIRTRIRKIDDFHFVDILHIYVFVSVCGTSKASPFGPKNMLKG